MLIYVRNWVDIHVCSTKLNSEVEKILNISYSAQSGFQTLEVVKGVHPAPHWPGARTFHTTLTQPPTNHQPRGHKSSIKPGDGGCGVGGGEKVGGRGGESDGDRGRDRGEGEAAPSSAQDVTLITNPPPPLPQVSISHHFQASICRALTACNNMMVGGAGRGQGGGGEWGGEEAKEVGPLGLGLAGELTARTAAHRNTHAKVQ